MFEITNEDRSQLNRLNKNKAAIFSLKKLFLTVATKSKLPADTPTLAAERIAIDIIKDAFHQLSVIQPDIKGSSERENLV